MARRQRVDVGRRRHRAAAVAGTADHRRIGRSPRHCERLPYRRADRRARDDRPRGAPAGIRCPQRTVITWTAAQHGVARTHRPAAGLDDANSARLAGGLPGEHREHREIAGREQGQEGGERRQRQPLDVGDVDAGRAQRRQHDGGVHRRQHRQIDEAGEHAGAERRRPAVGLGIRRCDVDVLNGGVSGIAVRHGCGGSCGGSDGPPAGRLRGRLARRCCRRLEVGRCRWPHPGKAGRGRARRLTPWKDQRHRRRRARPLRGVCRRRSTTD